MSWEIQEGPYQCITIISLFLSTFYMIAPCPRVDKATFLHEEANNDLI